MRTTGERGGALLLSAVVTVIVVGIAGAYVSYSLINSRSTTTNMTGLQALFTAEAGAARVYRDFRTGGTGALTPPTEYTFGRGTFTCEITNPQPTLRRVRVEGTHGGTRRRVEVILSRAGRNFPNFGLYEGNVSADPTHTLTLGGLFDGVTDQRDIIWGNVYTGGSLATTEDAQLLNLAGDGPAESVIFGGPAVSLGSSQTPPPAPLNEVVPVPDIPGMMYDARANDPANYPYYVNVAQELAAKGTPGLAGGGAFGGTALQIDDVNEAAHIFRENPDDRSALTAGTVKSDFFIEDPTQPIQGDPAIDGGDDAYGVRLAPGTGNERVYYVDGNLWLNGHPTFSYRFLYPEADGIKITFVVKGNIYLGDNMYYQNMWKDAIAFIAVKDDALPSKSAADFPGDPDPEKAARDWNSLNGSGNIFFGDPYYGTTERFESFLYAENNFYDNNIGAAGSMATNIFGSMSAGNHLKINRNLGPGQNARLTVWWDDKVSRGDAQLLDVPNPPASTIGEWQIVSWKQLP